MKFRTYNNNNQIRRVTNSGTCPTLRQNVIPPTCPYEKYEDRKNVVFLIAHLLTDRMLESFLKIKYLLKNFPIDGRRIFDLDETTTETV